MLGSLLDSTKTGLLKYIILFFIAAGAGGLVLMDVGGFFTGGTISPSKVAQVGDITITAQEFDEEFSETVYRQDLSTREAYQRGFAQQLLQTMVTQNLVYQAAYDNGLRISPDMMVGEIRQYLEPYINEETTAKEAFRNFLQTQGMSEKQLTKVLEKDAVIKILTKSVTDIAVVPGVLVSDFARASEHKRDISALVMSINSADVSDMITEDALKDHYEVIKELYAIPEKRSFNLIKFTFEEVGENLTLTDEQKRTYYEDNIDLFTVAEKRSIEQALVKDQMEAQKIYDAVKAGQTLNTAVNDVTGNNKAFREAEEFEKLGLLEDLGAPVFDAEEGDVLEPVKTPLGWHVVKVKTIIPAETKSFETVKDDVTTYLRDELLEEEFYDFSLNIEESLDSGMTVTEIAKQYDLKTYTVNNAESDDLKKVSFVEEPGNVLQEAFQIPVSESSFLFEDGNGYAALTVTSIEEKDYKPFEEVKTQVEENFVTTKKTELIQQRASELKAKIDSGEMSFDEAAKQPNVTLRVEKDLGRRGGVPDYLSQLGVINLFKADLGDTLLLPSDNYISIAKVDALSLPSMDRYSDAKIEDTGRALSSILQNINFDTYLQGLQQRHRVQINQEALSTLYAGENF